MIIGIDNAISVRADVVFHYINVTFIAWNIIDICYIASAETKRDWLICGHMTLDKCNVSQGK